VEKSSLGKPTRVWLDGSMIEGTQYNGKVAVINKSPEFIRDILPSMFYSFFIIFAHIVYMYTQNALLMMSGMLAYNIFTSPYFGLKGEFVLDNFNLSKDTEKKFLNDKRFEIPL